jgi:hypothetical protein
MAGQIAADKQWRAASFRKRLGQRKAAPNMS